MVVRQGSTKKKPVIRECVDCVRAFHHAAPKHPQAGARGSAR
jgi:hypothetical protein